MPYPPVPPVPPVPPARDRRVSFGAAVRARRTALGLSQEALARRAGCDRQSIIRVETATHSPSLDRVFVLADALELSLPELFRTLS
ncbi:MAG TPA: helix-turn-helix transcriptional regulator [Mycobacteriales bacterium]|nr:helix-turn-helix transcriptional regulator [Mycobacteriales bacterium]